MTERLLVASGARQQDIALLNEHRLVEFRREPMGTDGRAGDVFLGRVLRLDKGLAVAFVDVGLPQPGFLPVNEIQQKVSEGAAAVVQVSREARQEKGPRLTGRISLAGPRLVLTPFGRGVSLSSRIGDPEQRSRLLTLVKAIARPEEGFVVRTAAIFAEEATLAAEAERLRETWKAILARRETSGAPAVLHRQPDPAARFLRDRANEAPSEIVADTRSVAAELMRYCTEWLPEFSTRVAYKPRREWIPSVEEVQEQVEAALARHVSLPSGGWLLFESGESMSVIDVNAGRGADSRIAGRTALHVNLDAAREIARQIRLRNIGGLIVVDFIDLNSGRDRQAVATALQEAVAADPQPCLVGGMSRFGLVEMTRRRGGPSLAEHFTHICANCGGEGRVLKLSRLRVGDE